MTVVPEVGVEHSGQHLERCGFAGAIRSQKSDDLAGGHFKRQIVNGQLGPEDLAQRSDGDHVMRRGQASHGQGGKQGSREHCINTPFALFIFRLRKDLPIW